MCGSAVPPGGWRAGAGGAAPGLVAEEKA